VEVSVKAIQSVESILGIDRETFEDEDLGRALVIARALPMNHSYSWLGGLDDLFMNLVNLKGKPHTELVARMLLFAFLDTSLWRPMCRVPDSTVDELTRARERIKAELETSPRGHYNPFGDRFKKDFSVLRGKAMPVHTGIVDTYTALWRKPLIFGDLSQRVRFFRLLCRRPFGNKFFFQHHAHRSLFDRLNPAGRIKTYKSVVDLLEINLDHKGFSAASWFYDPQLESISPRLSYLAGEPEKGGAERFHVGEDKTGSAFAKSNTRRWLHEQGKYTPQCYLLVWQRDLMISWRKRVGFVK
jgi:hypothetical protein